MMVCITCMRHAAPKCSLPPAWPERNETGRDIPLSRPSVGINPHYHAHSVIGCIHSELGFALTIICSFFLLSIFVVRVPYSLPSLQVNAMFFFLLDLSYFG